MTMSYEINPYNGLYKEKVGREKIPKNFHQTSVLRNIFFFSKRQAAVILKLPRLADMEVGVKRVVFFFPSRFKLKKQPCFVLFL